ncbi:MAG: PGF-pre-PGF domain-containing protein [Candidatus Woesearchaeota archaeon]|nr:PGF-pre-PGF domain-containing protein [Candidatus Woesearchaeota archaeon]
MLFCKKNIIIPFLLASILLIGNILAFQSANQITGNASTVIICNSDPPNMSVVPNQVAIAGTLFSYQINASDPEGETILYSDDSDLFDISSTGLIEFTPVAEQEGSNSITITATDVCSSARKTFTLTIQPNPNAQQAIARSGTQGRHEVFFPPELAPPTLKTQLASKDSILEQNILKLQTIPAKEQKKDDAQKLILQREIPTQEPATTISSVYRTAVIIAGILLLLLLLLLLHNNRKIHTPSQPSLTQTTMLSLAVILIITSIGGTATLLSSIESLTGNAVSEGKVNYCVSHPAVLDIPNSAGRVGTLFTLQITATDEDGDTLTYSDDTNLFSIGDSTGLITFTPTSTQIGTHIITITTTDSCTQTTQQFTLTVNEAGTGNEEGSSAGGGGGGGGTNQISESSSMAEQINQYSTKKISPEIIVITKLAGPLTEIRLTLNQDSTIEERRIANNNPVHTQKLTTLPETISNPPSDSIVYQYLSISSDIPVDKITQAHITFTVEKKWINENSIEYKKIILQRFSEKTWHTLPTSFTTTNKEHYIYNTITPGFSIFAITAVDMSPQIRTQKPIQDQPTVQTIKKEIQNVIAYAIPTHLRQAAITVTITALFLISLLYGVHRLHKKVKKNK